MAESSVQRVPPQDIEAEQAVLGAVLLDNAALHRACEILTPDDFYRDAHRIIFEGMIELDERGDLVDLVVLTDYLKTRKRLEQVGGASYLTSLTDVVPTAANVAYHAKIIREKALLRNLIQISTEVARSAYEGEYPIETLLDIAEQRIFSISERRIKPSFYPIKDIVKESFEVIEAAYEKKKPVTGIPTGHAEIDDLTAGLQPGDLVVVAGRPSMGKTCFALGLARHAGIEQGKVVAIFSLEMSRLQLVLRMLCSEARVDGQSVRKGYLSRTDFPKLTTAATRLTETKIFIDDTPTLSVLEMRARARRLKHDSGLDLVIVDYLQLLQGRGEAGNREQEISEISRSLKSLAKEINVPVIALSQLNRGPEKREGNRPVLADLRESGALEQDADMVIFLYREELYHPTEENKGIAEIIIGKQRNGPVGTRNLYFNDRQFRFEDLDRIHTAEGG